MNYKKLALITCITTLTFSQLSFSSFTAEAKENSIINMVTYNNASYILDKKDIASTMIPSNPTLKVENNMFAENRAKLIKEMKDNSILIISNGIAPIKTGDLNYPFTPNRNLYYLTGIYSEGVVLVITKGNDQINEMLFIDENNPEMEKWVGKKLSSSEATEISGILCIEYHNNFNMKVSDMIKFNKLNDLYINMDRNVDSNNIEKELMVNLMVSNPNMSVTNVNGLIGNLRTTKSKGECENIQKAIDITSAGIKNMMANVKPGMMEYELEAYFDFTTKFNGVKEYGFPSIIASGKNGTVLHYDTNNNKIGKNDLILCDVGTNYKYYSADLTRTFPASGKFTERQKQIYNIVLKAQLETIKSVKPGVTLKDLNNITRDVFTKECKKIGLIKNDSELLKYYFHGVSHSLGLDTHDVGNTREPLKEGTVITIEPGLYLEDENIGIRIEDDVLVTKNGCEVLSNNLIKTVEEIEKFMSQRK